MPVIGTPDQGTIYYEDRGEGRPIVFVHGFGANRMFYRDQVEAFSEDYRTIALDLRGHGNSDWPGHGMVMSDFADDLEHLFDSLGLEDVTLVGWSMGGHIIFEYIRQYGCDRLDSICMIDGTPRLRSASDWEHAQHGGFDSEDSLKTIHSMMKNYDGFVEKLLVPDIFAEDTVSEETYEWALNQFKQNDPHVMINMWVNLTVEDYRSILSEVTVPALIAYGAKSGLYDTGASTYMAEEIPDSELVEFPEAGHTVMIEAPDDFNEALASFLD